MERRVVIIEDERDVARLLESHLQEAGFAVTSAGTATEGLAAVRAQQPDVVVLGATLPDGDGCELCKTIRGGSDIAETSVLMLVASGDAEDRCLGRDIDADDYVVRPFVVREVVLRVTALAKRLAERRARLAESSGSAIKVASIELDPATHDVRIGGVPTQLRPLEYKLLQLLMSDPGRVFTRDEILAHVWETGSDGTAATVDAHVKRLRASLGPASDVIETIHGFGYRVRPQSS
jgi:two-component system, OmpR family, phosphate regulon response regulator PhoB